MEKYIKVAEELNKVLGCKPPIDVEDVEKEDLIDDIKEAAAMIDTDEDSISKPTITILEELGVWINQDEDENEEDEKPKKKDKKKPVKEDSEPEDDNEPEDEKPKKKKPVKVEKKESKKDKPKKEEKNPTKSNKGMVYLAWKKGEKDQKKLLKLVKNAVKETTIKRWLISWGNGKCLPAAAKK